MVPAIAALRERFDVPISVDTWNPVVLARSPRGGCRRRQRHLRLRPPRLPARSAPSSARASSRPTSGWVLASPTPSPSTTTSWSDVRAFLADRAAAALDAGIPAERIMVDDGLDLGKTEPQSLELLRTLGPARRARVRGVPVGIQQAVPRRVAAPGGGRPQRGQPRGARAGHHPRLSGPSRPRRRRCSPDRRPGRRTAGTPRWLTPRRCTWSRAATRSCWAQGAREVIDRLVGDSDRNEVLTEFSGDEYLMGDVLIAASTVSMFGSRVVVARNAARFTADGSPAARLPGRSGARQRRGGRLGEGRCTGVAVPTRCRRS